MEDPLIPDSVRLLGVQGMQENGLPGYEVTYVCIRKDSVKYYVHADRILEEEIEEESFEEIDEEQQPSELKLVESDVSVVAERACGRCGSFDHSFRMCPGRHGRNNK